MGKTKKTDTTTTPKQQGRTAFTRRYRKWYSSLPASMQMVGLQLWLPLFFTLMFCLCYVFAFHQPKIHDVPVGYIDASPQASVAAEKLDGSFKGALDVRIYSNADEAVAATRHGEVVAALQPGQKQDTLYIASAHQFQSASLARQMLQPVIQAQGKVMDVKDLAPLPAYDLFGTVALYMMLVTCVGGYMVGMFLGMMGGPLTHKSRIGVLLGASFVLSLISQLIIGPVLGAEQGHFWQLWPLAWAWMFTIGLVVNGMGYFFGRFIAAFALAIFVFLSMPSSSGAYPAYFMPEPFKWLNHVVVGSGITEMIKHILYGVGPGLTRGYVMLGAYLLAGAVLTAVGKPYWERKRARNILAGRTTMFADAQKANTAHNQEVRKQIFKDAGLELPEDIEKRQTAAEANDDDELENQGSLTQASRTNSGGLA